MYLLVKWLSKIPPHLDCVATLPCEIFLLKNCYVKRDRVATQLRCGEIFYNHFTTNLLTNLPLKEFWKLVKIWLSYCHAFVGSFFGHGLVFLLVFIITKFARWIVTMFAWKLLELTFRKKWLFQPTILHVIYGGNLSFFCNYCWVISCSETTSYYVF